MEKCLQSGEFQSTLPVKGATVSKVILAVDSEFQSTLPVRGATLMGRTRFLLIGISIHAPREGSDWGP